METDLSHAILKVFRAFKDSDFDAHEVDGQIPTIDLWKPDGVLLGGDNHVRLPRFATVDGVENFLLGEPVVINKPFRINEITSKGDQALLETFR